MVHTRDFSKAPAAAQGEALFFGGTEYTGPRALLGLVRVWLPVARRMRAAPGYRGHVVWYRFPFTFGTVSFWASREDLMAFGRSDEHRRAVAWLLRPGNARGAFIRFHAAEAAGHTIGGWRAEPDPDGAWRAARYPFSTPMTLTRR
jgi:heme-degrading monooxygenase HmoA